MNEKFGEARSSRRKIKSLLAQVSRTSKVHRRQVPFGSAGFIVFAAYKVPARGTILNGSELGHREVASLARPRYVYRGIPAKHIGRRVYRVYRPFLNFKRNKRVSPHRHFRRMVAEATIFSSFFQSSIADLGGAPCSRGSTWLCVQSPRDLTDFSSISFFIP